MCSIVKMSKRCQWEGPSSNSSCHSKVKKYTDRESPYCYVSSQQKVPEKSLVSPSSHIKWREQCWEESRQQTWRQVKKLVSSSINYARVLSNQ